MINGSAHVEVSKWDSQCPVMFGCMLHTCPGAALHGAKKTCAHQERSVQHEILQDRSIGWLSPDMKHKDPRSKIQDAIIRLDLRPAVS